MTRSTTAFPVWLINWHTLGQGSQTLVRDRNLDRRLFLYNTRFVRMDFTFSIYYYCYYYIIIYYYYYYIIITVIIIIIIIVIMYPTVYGDNGLWPWM